MKVDALNKCNFQCTGDKVHSIIIYHIHFFTFLMRIPK